MKYFHVESNCDYGFGALVPRGDRVFRPGGCRQCETLPGDKGPPPLLLVRGTGRAGPLGSTSWGFGVVRCDLLRILEAHEPGCLRLGDLAGPDGEVSGDYRSFVGTHRVILRGDATSQHRICEACGALLYTYLPRGKPYVTTASVASRRAVYETELGLLVSEGVCRQLRGFSPGLLIYEVPVVDESTDGLPADISLRPTADQRKNYRPNHTAAPLRKTGGFLAIDKLARE